MCDIVLNPTLQGIFLGFVLGFLLGFASVIIYQMIQTYKEQKYLYSSNIVNNVKMEYRFTINNNQQCMMTVPRYIVEEKKIKNGQKAKFKIKENGFEVIITDNKDNEKNKE